MCSMCSSAGFTACPADHLVGGGGDVLLSVLETKRRGSQLQLDFIQSYLFPKVPADLNYCCGCQQVPPAYSVMIKVLRGFGLLMFLSVAADCEHKGCIK